MKRKLLLLTCAILLGSLSSVRADRTDVTSTYIQNADFSAQTKKEQAASNWNGTSSSNKAANFMTQTSSPTFASGTFVEMWASGSKSLSAQDLYQEIELPSGVYQLAAKGRADIQCYLYAGSISETCSGEEFGVSSEKSVTFIVSAGTGKTKVRIGFKHLGGSAGSNNTWVAVDEFKLYRVGDLAATEGLHVMNWDFTGCAKDNFPGWKISAASGSNTQNYGETCVEYWKSAAADGSFDYYQELSGLPSGKYNISASMWNSTNNETGATVNGNAGVYGTSSNVTVFAGVTDDCTDTDLHTYTTDNIVVSNGTLRLGVKNKDTMGARWFGVDWIKLNFVEPYISGAAKAFTSGSTMAAGQWYSYTVETAGDYGFPDVENIVYTTNGDQLLSEATGDELTGTVSLSATTYYIMSTTEQALTIPSRYTYTIGEGSADKSYVQSGNTVTVTYSSMTTTNTYTSEIDEDITGVTFGGNAIEVTRTTKGFQFTVPDVTAGTDYTLSIPANIIGYQAASSDKNAAQSITLHAPAILDGVYYFKANSTYNGSKSSETAACGKYLARGNASGTHATIDKYGLPIIVTTDGANNTTLRPADTKKYYYHHNSWDCWADRAAGDDNVAKFNVTLHDGEYRIHNVSMTSGKYLKYNNADVDKAIITVYDDGTGANAGPIINWTVETPATHATYLQGLKNTQAATAAFAAYNSGDYSSLDGITTVSGLETALASYVQGDFVPASEITTVQEKFQGSQPNSSNTGEIVYSNSINITKAGLYKFSMQAFYRCASNEVTQPMHENGYDFPPVILYFGDAETQIKSVYDESSDSKLTDATDWTNLKYNDKYYPNDVVSSLAAFKAGMYHNDVWVYISEAGTYSYGVMYLGYANSNSQWFIYSPESVTVTSYAQAADADDYTALQAKITAAEAAQSAGGGQIVLGFEQNEYAPYNNLGAAQAISSLPTAKAINQEATNSKLLVQSLTEELNVSWDINETELNAIYNGTFAACENDGAMAGWVTDHSSGLGGSLHARAFVLTSGDKNYKKLAAFGQGDGTRSCAFFRFDGTNSSTTTKYTYGSSTDYNMPLKTGKIYKLTAQVGGWGQTSKDFQIAVVNSSNSNLVAQNLTTPSTGLDSEGGTLINYEMYFVVSTAGDYKLVLTNTSGGNNAVVVSNMELFSTDALPISEDGTKPYAAGTYPSVTFDRSFNTSNRSTMVLPFAMDADATEAAFDEVYELSSVSGESLQFTSASSIEAGKPYLVKSKAAALPTQNDVALDPSTTVTNTVVVDGTTTVTFVGRFAGESLTSENSTAYIVSGNKLYNVASKVTIKPYRGYFTVETSGEAKAFNLVFDELPTAIQSVETDNMKDATIFNLAGQRVNKAQKGIYIVNGKKVLVK